MVALTKQSVQGIPPLVPRSLRKHSIMELGLGSASVSWYGKEACGSAPC